jgi:MOSC domain-containing protein YiiM
MIIGKVLTVLRGPVRPLGHTTSGIDKHPTQEPVKVDILGLAGDAQADLRNHGGEFKAVHCYAWSHYPAWREELPPNPLLDAPGAFGENLSLNGLDETTVCIGDRWRVGSVVFAVSQGRQPCFKLNLRFGVPDMAIRVQRSLRTGWYLRVVKPGTLTTGDAIELLERPHPDYSIASLLALIRDRETDVKRLEDVLKLPLPPSWQRLFGKRLLSGQAEDWVGRLQKS